MTKKFSLAIVSLLFVSTLFAQSNAKVHLTAKPRVVSGNRVIIQLSWDEDTILMSKINGFRLRSDFAGNEIAGDSQLPLIDRFGYVYEVDGVKGKPYLFTVFYEEKSGNLVPYTDTISVNIPNNSLPYIKIWPIEVKSKKITIYWNYDDKIIDLDGYRVFINGKQVASETDLPKNKKQWTSADLPKGEYTVKILAATLYGVESPVSNELHATITE